MFKKLISPDLFAAGIARHRRVLLTLILCLTAVFAWQLKNVALDGSLERIMLRNDPERLFNEQANEQFGGDEVVSVVLRFEDGVWHEQVLRQIDVLTSELEEIEGVSEVYSLTNVPIVERKVTVRAITLMKRLERGVELADLRRLAKRDPSVRRNLVAEDDRHAAINLRLVPLTGTSADFKTTLAQDIRDVVEQHIDAGEYHVAGWPIVQADVTGYMERDLGILIPAVAAIVMLLFAVGFRRLSGVLLPVTAIGIAQIWTVGGIAATGKSMSMVTYSLPIVIIAIGATYCIHVVSHIFKYFDESGDQVAAIRAALVNTAPSVLLSGLTTMVGFGALKLNRLEAINEFGTFAVWGIGVSVVMALVFLPSLAIVIPLRRKLSSPAAKKLQPATFLSAVLSQRRLVWVVTALVLMTSLYGVSKIRVETAPVSWFPPESPTRQSVSYVNENLAGITPYNIVIDTGRSGGVYELETLTKIDQLHQWLAELEHVDTTNSIVDPIKAFNRAYRRGGKFRLPSDQAGVDKVVEIIRSRDTRGLDAYVSDDGQVANVILRSPITSSEIGVEFARQIDDYLTRHFAGVADAKITGTGHLAFRTNIEFTNGLSMSLAIGVGAICLIMMLLFRSWKLGLLAMIPNIVPVLINYAILGLGDLTLNAATSITGCIAIGIAVDDTIHFLVAFRNGLKKTGDREAAVEYALAEVGRPMLVTSVALFAGFSVLLLSSFLPIASLGLLVAVTMVACLVCDTVLLPILLTTKAPAWLKKTTNPWENRAISQIRQETLSGFGGI